MDARGLRRSRPRCRVRPTRLRRDCGSPPRRRTDCVRFHRPARVRRAERGPVPYGRGRPRESRSRPRVPRPRRQPTLPPRQPAPRAISARRACTTPKRRPRGPQGRARKDARATLLQAARPCGVDLEEAEGSAPAARSATLARSEWPLDDDRRSDGFGEPRLARNRGGTGDAGHRDSLANEALDVARGARARRDRRTRSRGPIAPARPVRPMRCT